jgi:TRAP-type C4-dicarboxylate transport system substrate-binding protein
VLELVRRVARVIAVVAAVTATVAVGASAAAEPVTLRFASVAPDGSEWARLMRAFAREVEHATEGDVQIRWYFSGIAGGEQDMIDRIRRGQLDGAASGGMMCQRLAPSMRVMRIVGLFQSREEALHVLGKLRPRLDRELSRSGFSNLGEAGMGSDIIFSRTPIASLDDLRRAKFWVWDLDEVWQRELPAMGIHVLPLPVESAGAAYEDGRSDGFFGITTAALAFQWSTRARYFAELRMGYLMGCLVVSHESFDPLPTADQQAIRGAAAKLMREMENMGQQQESQLLGGLFERQGMHRVPVSDAFRSEFFQLAHDARDRLEGELTTSELLGEVSGWLADFRAQHR